MERANSNSLGISYIAGWNEREVAAMLADLADIDMLGLITAGEVNAIIESIKRS